MPPKWVEVTANTIAVVGTNTTVVYENDGVVVTAFNVNHPAIEPALGYKISFGGKSVVISGDTTATQTLVDQSMDADILVSEVMNMEVISMAENIYQENGYDDLAKIFADVQDYHISTTELGNLAEKAKVKTLVLTHLAPNLDNEGVMDTLYVKPISKLYSGEIILARDGDTIVLDVD